MKTCKMSNYYFYFVCRKLNIVIQATRMDKWLLNTMPPVEGSVW